MRVTMALLTVHFTEHINLLPIHAMADIAVLNRFRHPIGCFKSIFMMVV